MTNPLGEAPPRDRDGNLILNPAQKFLYEQKDPTLVSHFKLLLYFEHQLAPPHKRLIN